MKIHYADLDTEDIIIEELNEDKLKKILQQPLFLQLPNGEIYYHLRDGRWMKKKGKGLIAYSGEEVNIEDVLQKLKDMNAEQEVVCKLFHIRLITCLWCEHYNDYLNRMKKFWKTRKLLKRRK